jgi:hypothetical protein
VISIAFIACYHSAFIEQRHVRREATKLKNCPAADKIPSVSCFICRAATNNVVTDEPDVFVAQRQS